MARRPDKRERQQDESSDTERADELGGAREQMEDQETEGRAETRAVDVDEDDDVPLSVQHHGRQRQRDLRDLAEDVGPSIATGAIAAVGVAIVEKELLPALLIGVAATLVPKLVPGVGPLMRPVVKGAVRLGYGAYSMAQEAMAEASEQVQDMVEEVRAEDAQRRARASRVRARRATTEVEDTSAAPA